MSGFIHHIMNQQKDPDGQHGHDEREQLQNRSKRNRSKKKYIGLGAPKKPPPMMPWQKQEIRNLLDKALMKSKCASYKDGCTVVNCKTCKRKKEVN